MAINLFCRISTRHYDFEFGNSDIIFSFNDLNNLGAPRFMTINLINLIFKRHVTSAILNLEVLLSYLKRTT